jgi:hypothetical protein
MLDHPTTQTKKATKLNIISTLWQWSKWTIEFLEEVVTVKERGQTSSKKVNKQIGTYL